MNEDGCYFLWSGIGAIEDLDDADPLTDTPAKALDALKAKTEGHWTLWLRQGYRVALVATWLPRRKELTLIPIDCAELDGMPKIPDYAAQERAFWLERFPQ